MFTITSVYLLLILVNPRVCFVVFNPTDWAANFLSCDSYAVGSCAAARETSLPVLAVSWRERPAQTQGECNRRHQSTL